MHVLVLKLVAANSFNRLIKIVFKLREKPKEITRKYRHQEKSMRADDDKLDINKCWPKHGICVTNAQYT